MTLFKSLTILLITSYLLLAGCVKADRTSKNQESEGLREFSQTQNLIDFNNRALFEAGQIVLEDIQFSKMGDSDWKEVNQIRLYLAICNIKDRASQGTIRNEKFHVQSELGHTIFLTENDEKGKPRTTEISNPITVNSNNCLRWSQLIPVFDYLAPSMNVILHYEVKSLSGQLGKMVRRIGFNPWDMYRNNSKSRGFFDLTDFDRKDWYAGEWITGQDDVIAALKGDLIQNNSTLQLRSFNIEPVEREEQNVSQFNNINSRLSPEERSVMEELDKQLLNQAGLHMNINFSANPFVRTYDSTGVVHDIDLKTGKFKIFMNLFASGATDDSKKYLLSSNVSSVSGRSAAFTWEMTANGLLASVPMILKNRSEFGRMELLVKIEPVTSGLNKIKPFTAVFDLGNFDTWARRQGGSFKFDEKYQPLDQVDYDKYVANVGAITNDISTIREQDRFYFGPLRMRFVRIMPGESATDRTLQYSIYSCIEHGLYGNRVGRGLQFDIETEDVYRGRHTIRRQTNEEGCLTWFGFLSHKYYRKEVLEKKVAKVKFVGTSLSRNQFADIVNKYEQEFVYYFNPWDEKFTFGWDEPDMPVDYPAEVEKQRRTAPISQLFIADFRYETMGFRYEIDNYLNLKVKKAVLFKSYPYVLKYNSIVFGRKGTEPLRDGIYLMKVALQKDYLDPAAKGVRIYDKGLRRNNLAQNPSGEEPKTAYDMYDQEFGQYPELSGQGIPSQPMLTNENEQEINHRLLTDSELLESRKEFISTQTMLVRVLGGMIITPIEFEIDDLRLMRIRNQFFIQLQTIDEHKLRIATMIDQTFNEMFREGNIEQKYEEIFKTLDQIENIENEQIQLRANERENEAINQAILDELARKGLEVQRLRTQLDRLFGLDQFEEGSQAQINRRKQIADRLSRLAEYRDVMNGKDGLSEMSSFRNDKRLLINRIMSHLQQEQEQAIRQGQVLTDVETPPVTTTPPVGSQLNSEEVDTDPFLRFFFSNSLDFEQTPLSRIMDYKIAKAREAGDTDFALDMESLQITDFTLSPLAPSFSFDMLRNDGAHNPDLPEDDGKSGLPSRTFVGPLTFVFNTNGSSVRPTDILNEQFCTTAFCDKPAILREQIEKGVPPTPIDSTLQLDENGQLGFTGEAIFDHSDSVNADYENNKYYGYLREYFNVTVDDLIKKKKIIEANYVKKMEAGSQIINFTKTMGLKYVLLNDHPESRLKAIDYGCVERTQPDGIKKCFSDIQSGPDVLKIDKFMEQLNHRRARVTDSNTQILESGNIAAQFYDLAGQSELSKADIEKLMVHGWQSREADPLIVRKFMHRMCFVLAQNFFTDGYFEKPVSKREMITKAGGRKTMNRRSLIMLETECHKYLANVYKYDMNNLGWSNERGGRDLRPQTQFSPVILERKVRAYRTTNRYVYRGGKSLNINLSANFTLSSSFGVKTSTTANFKPWEWAKDTFGDVLESIPVVGPIGKNIVGAFSVSRSNARDEAAGRTQGLSVSSGTFLVNQQATFDIELGEYERCLVVRLHPAFIKDFISRDNLITNRTFIKDSFNEDEDIAAQGVLICSGNRERECLPVKERYYYFTQHFTEGDMLDTADLHNHPWLLQMRGFRDFQTFTAMIGAREVGYIDNNKWINDVMSQIASDAASFKLQGSQVQNMTPQFEVANQSSDINWPLDELSRTYFEVLPTFPSFYTFMNEESDDKLLDWPYRNTDPGQAFTQCEQ